MTPLFRIVKHGTLWKYTSTIYCKNRSNLKFSTPQKEPSAPILRLNLLRPFPVSDIFGFRLPYLAERRRPRGVLKAAKPILNCDELVQPTLTGRGRNLRMGVADLFLNVYLGTGAIAGAGNLGVYVLHAPRRGSSKSELQHVSPHRDRWLGAIRGDFVLT